MAHVARHINLPFRHAKSLLCTISILNDKVGRKATPSPSEQLLTMTESTPWMQLVVWSEDVQTSWKRSYQCPASGTTVTQHHKVLDMRYIKSAVTLPGPRFTWPLSTWIRNDWILDFLTDDEPRDPLRICAQPPAVHAADTSLCSMHNSNNFIKCSHHREPHTDSQHQLHQQESPAVVLVPEESGGVPPSSHFVLQRDYREHPL